MKGINNSLHQPKRPKRKFEGNEKIEDIAGISGINVKLALSKIGLADVETEISVGTGNINIDKEEMKL